MNPDRPGDGRRRLNEGFTFSEVLMAIAIAAVVIAGAVTAYNAVTQSNTRLATYGEVELETGVATDLYGKTVDSLNSYYAPNYGRMAQAEVMKETFYEDIGYASAVFCLTRNSQTTANQRPSSIPVSATYDQRRIESPTGFQAFLATAIPATDANTIFSEYRGAATARNLSIFILAPSGSPTGIAIRAIYELDFVPTKGDAKVAGVYVSLRRFVGTTCTDYYDIFYPDPTKTIDFLPTVVQFEREARLATSETGNDLLKVAANRPFYFVWWPDPAMTSLKAEPFTAPAATDPRSLYASMTGRTSFFLVVPMFPAL